MTDDSIAKSIRANISTSKRAREASGYIDQGMNSEDVATVFSTH
jgi:hypothetical protein